MPKQRTLSIIKPDAAAKNVIGRICARLEDSGLAIIASRMIHLTEEQAQAFYIVHNDKPFYGDLVRFMTSGRVVVQVLEGADAIARNREVMGATDPAKAAEGTIRRDYGSNIESNAVHGSDSAESARIEINFFFPELED